ncbi:MAG TPA: hypothetical protein PKV40_09385, partial [Candidatus Kapabacteria bacterium]|nr:hypothetical protein [Candidatus Kapabacteria bacterium]
MKDEAHHIYDEDLTWKKMLIDLHNDLQKNYGKGFNMELDFSATPKTKEGNLFPWLIVDFPLKEAFDMNIIKKPLRADMSYAKEIASDDPTIRYRDWIDAGIRRWREYKGKLAPLGKKPIIFFQCDDNKNADEIYKFVNSEGELKNKVLLIHTDNTGNITKDDLGKAREAARTIDDANNNRYEAIVSTMMLNEGWDVRNVNVIVGLRGYSSKRKILPEQVIGRGLRKMFPDDIADPERSINTLEVIGSDGLIEIIKELENQEDIKVQSFDIYKEILLTSIMVDNDKFDKDIKIPILTPRIKRNEPDFDKLAVDEMPSLRLEFKNIQISANNPFEYIARDMFTDEIVLRRKWDMPVIQEAKSVAGYYANLICKELHLVNSFAKMLPIVKGYISNKLFNRKVDFDDPKMQGQLLYNLIEPVVQKG